MSGRFHRGSRAYRHDLTNQVATDADANGSTPDRADLLTLGWALDAVPFVHVTARANIDTLTLGYALDGVPFIGLTP